MTRRIPTSAFIVATALVIGACGGTPGATSAPGTGAAATGSAAPTGLTETVEVTSYVGGVTSSAPHDYAGVTEGIYAKYS